MKLGLGAGALHAVAGSAQQLQVVEVVVSAFGAGDDVIDFEVSEVEVLFAAGAVTFLLAAGPIVPAFLSDCCGGAL